MVIKKHSSIDSRPATKEELRAHFLRFGENDGRDQESREQFDRLIDYLVEEAFEQKPTPADLEREFQIKKKLRKRQDAARKRGEPQLLIKIDAKTGERIIFTNEGDYKSRTPNPLVLCYDFYTALFRLSEDNKMISANLVLENIKDHHYQDMWLDIINEHVSYAEKVGILESSGEEGDLQIRPISGEKLDAIRLLINTFDRPSPEYLNADPNEDIYKQFCK